MGPGKDLLPLAEPLRQNLPREVSEPMFAHANQVVLAWQQARRAGMN